VIKIAFGKGVIVRRTLPFGIGAKEVIPNMVKTKDRSFIALRAKGAENIGLLGFKVLKDITKAIGVGIATGGDGDTGGNALAVDGEVVFKNHSTLSKAVQVGGFAIGIAHKGGTVPPHLIRGKYNQVAWT
jgi:hypothetical protein